MGGVLPPAGAEPVRFRRSMWRRESRAAAGVRKLAGVVGADAWPGGRGPSIWASRYMRMKVAVPSGRGEEEEVEEEGRGGEEGRGEGAAKVAGVNGSSQVRLTGVAVHPGPEGGGGEGAGKAAGVNGSSQARLAGVAVRSGPGEAVGVDGSSQARLAGVAADLPRVEGVLAWILGALDGGREEGGEGGRG